MAEGPWDGSAEAYRAEADRISFYRITNRELVAAAGIRPGMVVVDLACGAGLTTRTILAALDGAGTVYAIDQAEAMLRQAQAAVGAATVPAVRFVHARADAFGRHLAGPADRVLCNAAFWHFPDPDAVLQEVRAVLRADGCFLFNLPDQVFDFGDGRGSAMTRVVAACLDQPLAEEMPEHSEQTIRTLAASGGFSVVDFRVLEVGLKSEDLLRFYTLPHVGARRFPDLPPVERLRRLTAAFARLPRGESVPYRWAQFTLAPLPQG